MNDKIRSEARKFCEQTKSSETNCFKLFSVYKFSLRPFPLIIPNKIFLPVIQGDEFDNMIFFLGLIFPRIMSAIKPLKLCKDVKNHLIPYFLKR